MPDIAIVGMACEFAGAHSPEELWENVVAQRSAFRRMPATRLRLEDYFSLDRRAEDRTYGQQAAVLEGWEFDRARYRVSGEAFRSSDMAHWLALDVAAAAIRDGGDASGEWLPRASTGVYVGNTLTGETSRANALRLRWPYVRRVALAAFESEGLTSEVCDRVLSALESSYKAPFAAASSETLAGSLSNTIAGRICNYFDFNGGGYTVDGACASSLLAISQACAELDQGRIDAAIAGGVDLSLDPFELVGFAKAGALAEGRMLVYDQHSAGFIPGEGCGMVVLMRATDATARGLRIHAIIRGWGISSDGSGGLTRPDRDGQQLAIGRAWKQAERDLAKAVYFEGHGTGTPVGDATELAALAGCLEAAGASRSVALGSIKPLIGHCKAAAGIAGVIKTALVLGNRTCPPTAGCELPHRLLAGETRALRVLRHSEPWLESGPMLAGVSGMGFGGINAHLVMESSGPPASSQGRQQKLARSSQDAEILFFQAEDTCTLIQRLERVLAIVPTASGSELSDLAAKLARSLGSGSVRAAVVAATPVECAEKLTSLLNSIRDGKSAAAGTYFGLAERPPRIGFLFPGQGSPTHGSGGAWRRRFETVDDLYRGIAAEAAHSQDTAVAQPSIVRASMAGLRVLHCLGLNADIAVGHSLGELSALQWAGVMNEAEVIELSACRGRAMGDPLVPAGAMAAILASASTVETLICGEPIAIAGFNSQTQTAVAGTPQQIDGLLDRCHEQRIPARRIPVSRAFHSPLMEGAAQAFQQSMETHSFLAARRDVASTITGAMLNGSSIRQLLIRQIVEPVRFLQALAAAGPVDLWIECGPGAVLSGLARDTGATAFPLDVGGVSLRPLLESLGGAWTCGAAIQPGALFADRFTRPFSLDRQSRFLSNPCEQAPIASPAPVQIAGSESAATPATVQTVLETLREVTCKHSELPPSTVTDESRMLSDLHLNSLVVGRIVADACQRLGCPPPLALTEFADATLSFIASAIEEIERAPNSSLEMAQHPAGVASWARAFRPHMQLRPLPVRTQPAEVPGKWSVYASPDDLRRDDLLAALSTAGGSGIAVLVPEEIPGPETVRLLLQAGKAAIEQSVPCFLLVTQHSGCASFAKSLHLESPRTDVRIVRFNRWDQESARRAADETRLTSGFLEARYDDAGQRWEPSLALIERDPAASAPLTVSDLMLVTGGGKGITSECALQIARATGVRLVLLGRSAPEHDPELASNLERIRSFVPADYVAADVTDAAAVRLAIRAIEEKHGRVTAVLHGAGTNRPCPIANLTAEEFERTLAPKRDGLKSILEAIDPSRLRLLAGFGSIIGRAGLEGEAHYAVANETLASLIESWGARFAHCRALVLDWSVWSGLGMGPRLGTVERLLTRGVTPLSPDQGVALLMDILAGNVSGPVVLTGRFGNPPTVRFHGHIPFRRYLQNVRLHYPGVELIADVDLSAASDPYIMDHQYRGQPLFPGVMGLEAMAQVSMALGGWEQPPRFEAVHWERPIGAPSTLRVAALRREDGSVAIALRCSSTNFQVDHCSAICHPAAPVAASQRSIPSTFRPADEFYRHTLFQRGRYQRLLGYGPVAARQCQAAIESRPEDWFDRYAPQTLDLGDPGARDAVLHSIQACVPHRVLLPVGVEEIEILDTTSCSRVWTHARERSATEDTFVYDVEVMDEQGAVRERWRGLRLVAVEYRPVAADLPEYLIPVYLERRAMEAVPSAALQIALSDGGPREGVTHRPDGKPDSAGSVSYCESYRFSVNTRGCDLETVTSPNQHLLRDNRLDLAQQIAAAAGEAEDQAVTRVWGALESLKKAGLPYDAPLTLRRVRPLEAVELVSGSMTILSCPLRLPRASAPVICSIAIEVQNATCV